MIEVTNNVKVYQEANGKHELDQVPDLIVKSHWNRPEFVVLVLPDNTHITVSAKDLAAAIKNATNTARW